MSTDSGVVTERCIGNLGVAGDRRPGSGLLTFGDGAGERFSENVVDGEAGGLLLLLSFDLPQNQPPEFGDLGGAG